jgi:hypothetical protein
MNQVQALSQHLFAKYGQEVSTPSSQRPTVPEPASDPMLQAEKNRESAVISLMRARDVLQSLQNHYAVNTPGGFNNPPAPFHGFHAKMTELEHLLHYIEQIELMPLE